MTDVTFPPLRRESLGHLAYLHRVLTGAEGETPDLGRWDGFYVPRADAMNFGLRFQLAFAATAVAALGLRTPAYTRPYVAALDAAVQRMLDVRAWGYWRPAPQAAGGDKQPAGHVALLLGGHTRPAGPLPPPADPVVQDNVQFSGHLGTMLGLYERAGGDQRYDAGFVLADPESGVAFPYTHSAVIERIVAQMRANPFHGVACEPACAYVPCNNHAMTATALHDATHGTTYAAANADWLDWVRRKMVLRGPAARGLFGACYLRDLHLTAPVAFQFTDSWGLAFLLPFDPALVRKLYPRFRKRMSRAAAGLHVGSAPICEKMEISDVALNTAFGLIVARGVGDTRTADRLAAYAAATCSPQWDGSVLRYAGAPRTLHSTALYALAELVDGEGLLLQRLFHEPRDPTLVAQPCLDRVAPGGSDSSATLAVGVSEAHYTAASRTLTLGLSPLGAEPTGETRVVLECARVPAMHQVRQDGVPVAGWRHAAETGALHIPVTVRTVTRLEVQLA
ncbi:MAG TPA: hypothetical protein VM536_00070 [Chloroflexia bacterium]|nr:hypothetical protein [Chloroflexia bacterium]